MLHEISQKLGMTGRTTDLEKVTCMVTRSQTHNTSTGSAADSLVTPVLFSLIGHPAVMISTSTGRNSYHGRVTRVSRAVSKPDPNTWAAVCFSCLAGPTIWQENGGDPARHEKIRDTNRERRVTDAGRFSANSVGREAAVLH